MDTLMLFALVVVLAFGVAFLAGMVIGGWNG